MYDYRFFSVVTIIFEGTIISNTKHDIECHLLIDNQVPMILEIKDDKLKYEAFTLLKNKHQDAMIIY